MLNEKCGSCDKSEPKFRCGACRKISYCSKECQKSDWLNHKRACNGLVNIVIVDGDDARQEKMQVSLIDESLGWEPCIVPGMIGIPLMVKCLRKHVSKPDREVGIFLMVDPETGLAARKWQANVGVVAFAKTDKTDFSVDLFWDIYSYIYSLMDYYGESNFSYSRFKDKKLIPNAFRIYQKEEHKYQEQYQEYIKQFNLPQA